MKTNTTKRPKWAKCLTNGQWRHLCDVQGPRPTLKQLRADVAYQKSAHGCTCWTCLQSLKAVEQAKGRV